MFPGVIAQVPAALVSAWAWCASQARLHQNTGFVDLQLNLC